MDTVKRLPLADIAAHLVQQVDARALVHRRTGKPGDARYAMAINRLHSSVMGA